MKTPFGLKPALSSSPDETVLSRGGASALVSSENSLIQNQVDGLVSGFIAQASDWKSIAAMTAGGLTYRWGRIGVLNVGAIRESPLLARPLSIVFGLSSEVTAFEFTHRALITLSERAGLKPAPTTPLWSWSGPGGWKEGWLTSFVTFGTLKGFGKLSQGQNLILQHGVQDVGMVAGHQLSYLAGIGHRPEGTLAEQLLHAEMTNLQIGAGMALGHHLTSGKILAVEKALDLSLQNVGAALRGRPGSPIRQPLQDNFAAATINGTNPPPPPFSKGGNWSDFHSRVKPMMMSAPGNGGRGTGTADSLHTRLSQLGPSSVLEVTQALKTEWDKWLEKNSLPLEERQRLKDFLHTYGRFALAWLGNQTPAHLPFVQEVFEKAKDFHRSQGGEALVGKDRNTLIRFLSGQPRRKSGEELDPEIQILRPSRLSLRETRSFMATASHRWEKLLRDLVELSPGSALGKAPIYQRGLALMHFYVSYLHARFGDEGLARFEQVPFQLDLYKRVLEDALTHPYPEKSRQIFEIFFRQDLDLPKEKNVQGDASFATPSPDLDPLPLFTPRYEPPLPGETWRGLLERMKISAAQLTQAEVGVKGNTILGWGTEIDKKGRPVPPGDILHLLGLITYINSSREPGIDPLDAARLTMPEQLKDLRPDKNGDVLIRFPELMADLDYNRFTLAALLRAYLSTTPQARDMDLAAQWGVSPQTVAEYRRGIVKKMHLKTLSHLAEALVPKDDSLESRQDMFNLLMFLRYRPYFEATMEIVDVEGNPLNRRPPLASRFRIVLSPHGQELRSLDITRRIQFEREPFASAMNGAADLALRLLEGRLAEFELSGEEGISAPEGHLSHEGLRRRIHEFRDDHAQVYQILSQHERSPGVVRPGELKDLQSLYKDLFRFFEAIYLHARPEGTVKVGDQTIPYQIVPPTLEHPKGVRFDASHAYVVAADLLENGREIPLSHLREILKLRVAKAYLNAMYLLPAGEDNRKENDKLLIRSIQDGPMQKERWFIFSQFEDLQKAAEEWQGTVLDTTLEATIHRITRGRITSSGHERRRLRWEEDLHRYILKEKIASIGLPLQEAFETYLKMLPHPYLGFHPERFEEALAPVIDREGNAVGSEVRVHLLHFMKRLGIPNHPNGKDLPPLSVDGFANSVFATYLYIFRSTHPFRMHGRVLLDPTLMIYAIEDRLVDFPQLSPHQDKIAKALEKLIEDYNRRTPPLRIFELADSKEAELEPYQPQSLSALYSKAKAEFVEIYPEAKGILSERLSLAALKELRDVLERGEFPDSAEVEVALGVGRERLIRMGLSSPLVDPSLETKFFGHFLALLHSQSLATQRLSSLIPAFVTGEKFQSGLEDPKQVARDILEVHRHLTLSQILDAEPLTMGEAIQKTLGDRFSPYGTIREDVIRGMKVIYHEFLTSMRRDYSQVRDALEASLEEAKIHRNLKEFWETFTALASEVDPSLNDQESLKQRIQDLETLFHLMPHPPLEKLSEMIEHGVEEMKKRKEPDQGPSGSTPPPADENVGATPRDRPREGQPQGAAPTDLLPPIDPKPILEAPLSKDLLEKYPELELADEKDVAQEIQELEKLRRDLIIPEAKPILQLLGLLRIYEEQLDPNTRETIEALRLEVETSPAGENLGQIAEKILKIYSDIRHDILKKVSPFDRVGLLPEIRASGPRLTDLEAGWALQNWISKKDLPLLLQEKLLKIIDAVIQEKPENRDQFRYFFKLVQFYLDYRSAILKAPELSVPKTDPLEEFPELALTSDSLLPEIRLALSDLKGVDLNDLELYFWNQEESKPLLKMISLIFTSTNWKGHPLEPFVKDVGLHLNRVWNLLQTGASPRHFAIWATDRMRALYQEHRSNILLYLGNIRGLEKLIPTFPEIKKQEIYSSEAFPEELQPRPNELFQVFAKAVALLRKTPLKGKLEVMLWDIRVNDNLDTLENDITTQLIKKVLRFYLEERLKNPKIFLRAASSPDVPEKKEEMDYAPFYELSLLENAIQSPEYILRSLQLMRQAVSTPSVVIGSSEKNGRPEEIIIPRDESKRVREILMTGKRARLESRPEIELGPEDLNLMLPVIPLAIAEQAFFSILPRPHLLLQSSFAKLGFSNLSQTIDVDRHIAICLLRMGIEPEWVLNSLKKRNLRFYLQFRSEILSKFDFPAYVSQLPEIQAVPDYKIEGSIKKAITKTGIESLEGDPQYDLAHRLGVIFELETLPKKLNQQWHRLADQNIHVGLKKYYQILSRFYLEHRQEILLHLKPWPTATTSNDPISLVSQLPEIQAIPDREIERIKDRALQKTPNHPSVQLPANFEIHARILYLLLNEKVPEALQVAYHDIGNFTNPKTAEFYLEHREEILFHLGIKAEEKK